MIRYFLDQKSHLTSMCLQGITVYNKINNNQMFEKPNKYLDFHCKKGLLYFQEISKSGEILFDSFLDKNKPIKKVESEKEILTINNVEEIKPVKKGRKKKDA
jgi:hypothetical protein